MIVDPQADLPDFGDIQDAASRLEGVAVRTPLLRSEYIDERVGAPVWFKAECLQRTGSFKIRGAWNRISRIPETERSNGVIAYSSGNHAQGVAASARRLSIPATIVMPSDAPGIKIEATRNLGASIRLYDRQSESREEIGDEVAAATGATLIRPFDDAFIIAGQATATLEAVEDARNQDVDFAAMFCPASGGGLLAGAALVLNERAPRAELFVAEPEGHDDHIRSIAAGRIVRNAPGFHTSADALMAPQPGDLTFRITKEAVASGIAVNDRDIYEAMRIAFTHLKVVIEPGGAVAFAAALKARTIRAEKRPILIMLSGGNVDPATFRQTLDGRQGEINRPA